MLLHSEEEHGEAQLNGAHEHELQHRTTNKTSVPHRSRNEHLNDHGLCGTDARRGGRAVYAFSNFARGCTLNSETHLTTRGFGTQLLTMAAATIAPAIYIGEHVKW